MNWRMRTSYGSNRSAFVDELSFLNRKQGKATPPIRVTQFGLFLREDQTVKWKGRIGNSSLQISTKFPILLPAKHAFVSLLVKRTHDRVKHSGINATLKKTVTTTHSDRSGSMRLIRLFQRTRTLKFSGIDFLSFRVVDILLCTTRGSVNNSCIYSHVYVVAWHVIRYGFVCTAFLWFQLIYRYPI